MPTVSLPHQLRRARPVVEDLEAALVRRSVDALALDRPTCRHCRRTPLVGEHVYLYVLGRDREEIVCELCRPRRTAQPDETLVVHSEAAGSVRAFRGAAA
jgi:hypothetical protein